MFRLFYHGNPGIFQKLGIFRDGYISSIDISQAYQEYGLTVKVEGAFVRVR